MMREFAQIDYFVGLLKGIVSNLASQTSGRRTFAGELILLFRSLFKQLLFVLGSTAIESI